MLQIKTLFYSAWHIVRHSMNLSIIILIVVMIIVTSFAVRGLR